jgi:hypothetical protein
LVTTTASPGPILAISLASCGRSARMPSYLLAIYRCRASGLERLYLPAQVLILRAYPNVVTTQLVSQTLFANHNVLISFM